MAVMYFRCIVVLSATAISLHYSALSILTCHGHSQSNLYFKVLDGIMWSLWEILRLLKWTIVFTGTLLLILDTVK